MRTQKPKETELPPPITIDGKLPADDLLAREWVIANRLGAYASGTALGACTRKYHGLLVAARRPPVGKVVVLNCVLDQLVVPGPAGETTYDLSTFEFDGALRPDCGPNLVEFRNDVAPTFVFRCGQIELTKEIMLADQANAVAVRYRLKGSAEGAFIRVRPFFSLRDFHGQRKMGPEGLLSFTPTTDGVRVEDHKSEGPAAFVWLSPGGRRSAQAVRNFTAGPQWWHRFRYRTDIARGHEGYEDLYTPGTLDGPISQAQPVQLTCSIDEPVEVPLDEAILHKRRHLARMVEQVGRQADLPTRRLAMAADTFMVHRRRSGSAQPGWTIVAGYHWFSDWGRDSMIAMPGLMLCTGRHSEALSVLRVFGEAIEEGMVPNCFDDYGRAPHFNSIDASLWFIIAADRYVSATGDVSAWRNELGGWAMRILQAYHDGTRYGIHADADGLLTGGDEHTQLTWMDAKLGSVAITPRWGKPVEINALWYAALRTVERRCDQPRRAQFFGDLAERVQKGFAPTFWNSQAGCLYDCVHGEVKDASIRPNQVLAVSLPYCPLSASRQRSVVEVVRRELLTPFGLRTLSPQDHSYRGHYGTSIESRDRAYHQGTVWPWLIGPFIEAYLRVNDFSDSARKQARQWLSAFDEHLAQAGVGFISEVFDGDPPHGPGGCIAQAWSVAEVLRAKLLCLK